MTKISNDDDDEILKDGERIRVSMLTMDSAQQNIIDQQTTVLADGMRAGLHRPGYRYVSESPQAREARDAMYDSIEKELSERWQTAAPGLITSVTDDSVLDQEFDDCYQEYEHRLQNAYKGGNG
jgi:3-oxoacyl-ACP reductase-like protein